MGFLKRVEGLLNEIADNTSKTSTVLDDIYNLAEEAQKDAIRRDNEAYDDRARRGR